MSVISGFIKKLPYIRQLVSRIQALEQSVSSSQETIAQLLDIMKHQNDEQKDLQNLAQEAASANVGQALLPLYQKVDEIDRKLNALKNDITYYYFRGLHPDQYREALCEWYQSRMNEPLDLDNPRTLHQKIQWLKLYEPRQIKTLLADKYLVRDWVAKKVGPGHMIPLLGAWNSFDEIDLSTLPNRFVLKANNGSARNIIVTDKSKLDIPKARNQFAAWMSYNFAFTNGLELQYKDIPPKIIAEQYFPFESGISREYRFYCLNGVPRVVWVADVSSRHTTKLHCLYTMDWRPHPEGIIDPDSLAAIEKPSQFDRMKEIAQILSEDVVFVRMDFFEANGKAYLGEFTFTPASGASRTLPDKVSQELGALLYLPGFPEATCFQGSFPPFPA